MRGVMKEQNKKIDKVPLKNIEVTIDSVSDDDEEFSLKGTLKWSSVNAPFELVQQHVSNLFDLPYGYVMYDLMIHEEEPKWILLNDEELWWMELNPGEVSKTKSKGLEV